MSKEKINVVNDGKSEQVAYYNKHFFKFFIFQILTFGTYFIYLIHKQGRDDKGDALVPAWAMLCG